MKTEIFLLDLFLLKWENYNNKVIYYLYRDAVFPSYRLENNKFTLTSFNKII